MYYKMHYGVFLKFLNCLFFMFYFLVESENTVLLMLLCSALLRHAQGTPPPCILKPGGLETSG